MNKKEIIVPTISAETAKEIAENEINHLLKRSLYVDAKERAEINDMITKIKQRLKDYIDNLNN